MSASRKLEDRDSPLEGAGERPEVSATEDAAGLDARDESRAEIAELKPTLSPREAEVLAAALQAFARFGYHGTSIRRIAQMLDRSVAALYSHYPSKEVVLGEIILAAHEKLISDLLTASSPEKSHADNVLSLFEAHVLFHCRYRAAAIVANHELENVNRATGKVVRGMRHQIEEMFEEALDSARDAGQMSFDPDPSVVARVLSSMGVDVSRWYNASRNGSPDEFAAIYTGLVEAMLGARGQRIADPSCA